MGNAETIMISYDQVINRRAYYYRSGTATYAQPYKFISDWKNTYAINTSDVAKPIELLEPSEKFIFDSSEIYGSQENATEESINIVHLPGKINLYRLKETR